MRAVRLAVGAAVFGVSGWLFVWGLRLLRDTGHGYPLFFLVIPMFPVAVVAGGYVLPRVTDLRGMGWARSVLAGVFGFVSLVSGGLTAWLAFGFVRAYAATGEFPDVLTRIFFYFAALLFVSSAWGVRRLFRGEPVE